jgi:hypothetical protein
MITLEYNGTEQALAAWGFALDSAQAQHNNLAPSVYQVNQPGADISAAPAFPYRGKVIVRRNRTGSGTSWSGGYVAFIGYRIHANAYTSGGERGIAYTFANAWHFLQNTPFVQPWAAFNTVSESLEYKSASELLLFTELDGSHVLQKLNAGEQIAAVLQYLIDTFATQSMAQPFIIGTIDPDIPFPSYAAQEMSCEAVLQKCLQLSPDVVTYFDYSTSVASVPTPTIHFYANSSRTAASLAIENGTDHASLNIVPRHDLVPRSIVITYKVTNSVDGSVWARYFVDKYGPNGQNHASDPGEGLDVVLQTINLQGFTANNVFGSIATEVIAVNHATQSVRQAWWAMFHPEFASGKIRNVTLADATIKDRTGAAVSLATYPNRLLPGNGTLLPWMTLAGGAAVIGEWVEIVALVTFDEYDAATGGNLVRGKQTKQLKTSAIATNGVTGDYSSLGTFVEGETVPGMTGTDETGAGIFSNGIAKKVWDGLSALQYEGSDIRVQSEISNAGGDGPLVSLKNKLNLTGGLAAWATMAAQVQSITEHDGNGRTSISFGPRRILSMGGLAEMFQFNRLRRVFYNPAVRQTADFGTSGSSIQMPAATAAENSTSGLHATESLAILFGFTE